MVDLPPKLFLATYIIRIYRLKPNDPRSLVGIVEKVGGKGKKAFTHYGGLWDILNSRGKGSPRKESDPENRKREKKRKKTRKEEK